MHPFYSGGFLYDSKTGSVLLHKRDFNTDINPGKWGFFGGLGEGIETPKQAFQREIREELGIEIADADIVPLRDYRNEVRRTHRNVFFVNSNLPKSRMRLMEGADFDWISLDGVFEYDLTDKTADDLKFFRDRIVANDPRP